MRLARGLRARAALALLSLAPAFVPAPAAAQFGAVPKPADLVRVHAAPLGAPRHGHAEIVVRLEVLSGWHINAHPAAGENAIPTTLKVADARGVDVAAPVYPPPHVVKLPIDDQPMWVWDGTTAIRVPLELSKDAAIGTRTLAGELRFQACNDQICLPPATLPFEVKIDVLPAAGEPGAASGATPNGGAPGEVSPRAATPSGSGGAGSGASTSEPPAPRLNPEAANGSDPRAVPPSPSTFATAPPAGGARAIARSPLSDVLERGGWAAFLTLFLIGLALNLTPCVYPMLGVTVSIFGARRAAPPLQVFGSALLYVLGMAVMYSALGLAAAFTGGLFGGWLANPMVSIGIGVLLIALSLSMFGLYELNAPPALLSRIGGAGATSALGIFASGLVVGIFAAPCVGPPVVALLAVVGQKGDPWFGFLSFFTLAMGLGAPYLVLGTFSSLLQRMPRSGEWMVWVKKVFGVVLIGVGLNYVLLALAPRASVWVLPLALVAGGVWLGFLDKSASRRVAFRAFQRLAGALAVVAGVALVASAPRHALAFEPLQGDDAAARAGDQPYVIDFSADWCQPCHELDRVTFADRRVKDAMRAFRLYKVDLTRYDSPETERWRRRFQILGVPTIVFARPHGGEVREARVEGFLAPEAFLRRVELARGAVAEVPGGSPASAVPAER